MKHVPKLHFAILTVTCVCGGTDGSLVHAQPGDRFLSQVRQLTFEGRRAGEGYFSSDGQRLVFQSERYAGNPFFQIYTMDLSNGRSRLISPGVGRTTCSYFQPGTGRILFASTHLDPHARDRQAQEYARRNDPNAERVAWDYDEFYDLFTSDDRGRGLVQLTDTFGYDAEASFSPDGQHIVFCSLRSAYPIEDLDDRQRENWNEQPSYFGEIYIMNADGSDVRRLTDWPGYDGGPFFTADGKRIIWRHFEANGLIADVYTMNPDGTDRRRLTDFKSMSWAPYMHPSGDYAIFASNKLGFSNFELFVVDAMGDREPVRVTYTDGFDGLAVFSPDGGSLCWTTNRTSMESKKGQLFVGRWDHASALETLRSAPPRGTPESIPATLDAVLRSQNDGWLDGPLPATSDVGSTEIKASDLYQHVSILAHDDMQGRMTGTPGAQKAAEHIARQFELAGLKPIGDDGTFFQAFPYPSGLEMNPDDNSLSISVAPTPTAITLKADVDFRPLSFTSNGTVRGDVVFVGYGLVVPKSSDHAGYDSYDEREVSGKIVLVLDDVPSRLTTNERMHWMPFASPRLKAKQALQRGAVGFLLVTGPHTAGAGKLAPLSRSDSDAGIVAAGLTLEAAAHLLEGSNHTLKGLQEMLDDGEMSRAVREIELGVRIELAVSLNRTMGQCRNVVGLLPPAGDGAMSDEYVLVGAHYDHIGRGEAGGSLARDDEVGEIHNGADDNASGVAVLLEIATELADARLDSGLRRNDGQRPDGRGSETDGRGLDGGALPAGPLAYARGSEKRAVCRRGIIFAAWSGEEIGLIGSSHFARHAPCPLGQIAAYVNFDMVGRLRGGRLILQGVGSSSDWRGLIERVNVQQPLALSLQDDPFLPTDTTSFYPTGIPVLAFFTDVHDDYNRPSDDAENLNYPGMEQVARFGRDMVHMLAAENQKPGYVRVELKSNQAGGAAARRLYTGTIPDFAATDVKGMKISGVQPGSPAEKAQLSGGDVIIGLAGFEIGGLEDYAAVLRALKPNEPVEIVISRDGARKVLSITPSDRK